MFINLINLVTFCLLIDFTFCSASKKFENNMYLNFKNNKVLLSSHNFTDESDELNWKRRHKRRKKAINRTPRRGK